MSSPIDNKEWALKCYMDWVPAKDTEVCKDCGGKGTVGGGFKDMDGPRTCPTCFGRGSRNFHPKSKKPEIPLEVIEHMKKAWIDYWEVNSLYDSEYNK